MADFNVSFNITCAVEGGYAFDKLDRGGETFMGISRRSEPSWNGWPLIDKLKKEPNFPANLESNIQLKKQVLYLYKVQYWNSLNLSEIQDQRMADELYDTGVNMGVARAGLFFQRVLNTINRNGSLFPDLKLDGQVGSKTIGCFNQLNVTDKYLAWKLFNCLQGAKYIDICESDKTQEKFMRSWASRVFEN